MAPQSQRPRVAILARLAPHKCGERIRIEKECLMKAIAKHRFNTVPRTRLGPTYVTEWHTGDERCVSPMAILTIATKSAPWQVRGYNYIATRMPANPDGEPRPHRCVGVLLSC